MALVAGNDCITVATSRAYLLRYDYSQGSTPGDQPLWAGMLQIFFLHHTRIAEIVNRWSGQSIETVQLPRKGSMRPWVLRLPTVLQTVLEVELSKATDAAVRHVFMDATGAHTLVALQVSHSGSATCACWAFPVLYNALTAPCLVLLPSTLLSDW